MTDTVFVDSNVLLYAYDAGAGRKHAAAQGELEALWGTGGGALSVQVLQEFYYNATTKLKRPFAPEEARKILALYLDWVIFAPAPTDVIEATRLQERHRLSFWDSLIVLAARETGATVLLSEDFNHGQKIEGVRVHNPFLDPVPP